MSPGKFQFKMEGSVRVKLNRDGQKTDFAECTIYDKELGVLRTVDVYYAYYGKQPMWGVEVYQGPNYVSGASAKSASYSRHYPRGIGVPKKYVWLVENLKSILRAEGSKIH